LNLTLGIPHHPKVDLHEHGMIRLVGNVELGGHGLIGFGTVIRAVDELMNQLPSVARHAVEQFLREKAWTLRQAELHMRPADLIDAPKERLILFGGEAFVELLAQGGNHGQKMAAL